MKKSLLFIFALDISALNNGTYFLQLTTDRGKTTRKLIKS